MRSASSGPAGDAALVLGARVEIEGAVCVDQSDGLAALELEGSVREVLARLCPIDLRERAFPEGATARTLLNHVHVSLTRVSGGTWLVLMPRSMAGTVARRDRRGGAGRRGAVAGVVQVRTDSEMLVPTRCFKIC